MGVIQQFGGAFNEDRLSQMGVRKHLVGPVETARERYSRTFGRPGASRGKRPGLVPGQHWRW